MLTQNQMWHNTIIPPNYYDDYLKNKIIEIRDTISNTHSVSFAFLTDVHLKVNAWRSPSLIKFISESTNAIPFTIFGGDVPMATGTEEEVLEYGDQWLKLLSIIGKEKVYSCHGNHDYMCNYTDGSGSFYCNLDQLYYYIMKPIESKVNG